MVRSVITLYCSGWILLATKMTYIFKDKVLFVIKAVQIVGESCRLPLYAMYFFRFFVNEQASH